MRMKHEIVFFEQNIKGFIGAKKETIDGQEVWVKIAVITRQ